MQCKIVAEYLGWRYVPSNDLQGFKKPGWYRTPKFSELKGVGLFDFVDGQHWKFITRKVDKYYFKSNLDLLFEVVAKIETEDLKEKFYAWDDGEGLRFNFCGIDFSIFHGKMEFEVSWDLDPSTTISKRKVDYINIGEDLYEMVVEVIEWINIYKNNK